jgi:23S rRNA (uracil1939-C5)-methyltransferase
MTATSPEEKIISSLSIKKLIYGGNGLARDEKGKAIFVRAALPEEVVNVKIIREKKDYAEGIVTEILTPSQDRRLPLCPVFGACGGCQLQHLSYEGQALHKSEMVHEFMGQIKQDKPFIINPIIKSPTPLHYRLRVQLTVQNGHLGFYRTKSHNVVPLNTCPITIDPLNQVLSFLTQKGITLLTLAYGGTLPEDYTIELQGTISGEVLIVLIDPTGAGFMIEKLTSFFEAAAVAGVVLYYRKKRFYLGKDYLLYPVLGRKLRVSDRSFFQIHGGMHDLLAQAVLAFAGTGESRWLELHAGAGMFTIPLSEMVASIIAVEADPQAVLDAKFNVQKAGCKNAQIIGAPVEKALPNFAPHAFTHLLMDPPRAGITPETIKEIARLSPLKILYLSCHPATLVRDIKGLGAYGYQVQRVQPFDLFPQTGHVEILVELVRVS